MQEGVKTRNADVDSALLELLSELARYLIAAGVPSTRFSSIARLAYFQAASTRGRFSNERLNQSAVAAMTGLTRVQVRAFAKKKSPVPSEGRDRIQRVLEGWTTDPMFTGPDSLPRKLRANGRGSTFRALALRYGGDIPARSLLREMQRHGYVTIRAGRISLRKNAHETLHEMRVCKISNAMSDLLRASKEDECVSSPIRATTLEVVYPATSNKGRQLLHRRNRESLRGFVAALHAAGTAASVESPPGKQQKSRLTRTRVALITEDIG